MSQPRLLSDPLPENEKLAWLQLVRTPNVGPITFYKLLERCGSVQEALAALPELSKRGGRKKPLKAPDIHEVEREYERLRKMGGDIITAACPTYPIGLSAIDDSPPVISVLGDINLLNRDCIGVVGARNASVNGRKFAEKISRELGMYEQVIVSGLARGIDTAAHQGALKTGTIAVVAGGLDVVYPEENAELYRAITREGLVLAESALGQKPFAALFPRRNRIVSGLSKAVIVVEATKRSGSLITARLAAEQGRDVYAVPGSPMDPRAQGPNHLIREGATLVRHALDVIDGLHQFTGNIGTNTPPEHQNFEEDEAQQVLEFGRISNDVQPPEDAINLILAHLSFTPITVDELIRACHLSIPAVQTVLLQLELAGRIKRAPGGKVSLLDDA
ncbi:MAG: DNA-processing protein DprA [Pseudomonadota bacterium]